MFESMQLLTIILAAIGHCFGGGGMGKAPEYGLGFYNATDAKITGARADWVAGGAAHDELGGNVGRGASAIGDEQPRPIPEKATVRWTTIDGKQHQQELVVASLIPNSPTFSGTIYFKFNPDGGVRVVALTYEQELELANHGKPVVP